MSCDSRLSSPRRDGLLKLVKKGIPYSAKDCDVQEAIKAARLLSEDLSSRESHLVSVGDVVEFTIWTLKLGVKLKDPVLLSHLFRLMLWWSNHYRNEIIREVTCEFGSFRHATDSWGVLEYGGVLIPEKDMEDKVGSYLESLGYLSEVVALVSLMYGEYWVVRLKNELGKVKYEAEKRILEHPLRPWFYKYYHKATPLGLEWLLPSEKPSE